MGHERMTTKNSVELKGRKKPQNKKKSTKHVVKGPWYTAQKLAEYLALPSHRSVRELERRGILPGHRLGTSLRFSQREIDRFLLASRQQDLNEKSAPNKDRSIKENEPLVVNTLTEHLVFCLTVDPSLFLRIKSRVAPGQLPEWGSLRLVKFTLGQLYDLAGSRQSVQRFHQGFLAFHL